ncbi:hypothetical protein [Burkholderia pseudomallei]|uniref:hypothetical protein n=1 Tax=Burkholderia pseudomallei TaxID=28450 RepID=UPI000F08B88C|nr:hypothetical protein [Burkholderia pseudomallei]CAJ2836848.1 Uncharacterised protein [Burkholderia pseudomallei]VCO58475.1 Uncharacterised protein [Burkholderia pseudomallei]VCO68492.1 Uncharacterised protein [Burkholderia pseudomallei]VCO70631.1 Uncharacterised protein [Burkholderia pseudomallei]VCO74313.1 Uncharacterised protein [Burkholderia pseudomallei]
MPNDNVLTAEARATIMDACQSISRRADETKESNTSADGTWCDADEKAFYYAELSLLERLVSLLATTQQPRAEVTGGDELKARRLIRYGECRCILTQYCDGMCNPIYEDDARTGASTSALDAYKVAPVTLLEQQKRSIAERHFQGAPDVCRALKCIDEACAEMLTAARTGASS